MRKIKKIYFYTKNRNIKCLVYCDDNYYLDLDSKYLNDFLRVVQKESKTTTYDKLEIIDIAKKINTYETSILPYEDCCTIFVPKHPVIKPKLEKAIEYEKTIEYEKLIDECIENIKTITNFKEEYKDLL